MSLPNHITLDNIQQHALAALQADSVLATCGLFIEDGETDNDKGIIDALETGKGVAIAVQRIQSATETSQTRGATAMDVHLPVSIQVRVARNQSDGGTGETVMELIQRIIKALLGYPTDGKGRAVFRTYPPPFFNLGNEEGLEELIINFAGRVVVGPANPPS
jgi:hypothetical protein